MGLRAPDRCSCAKARRAGSARCRPGVPSDHVRHVLDRHDRRDRRHLLPCRPAILSPGCTRRFTAQIDLDHLEHARREIVARRDLQSSCSSKRRSNSLCCSGEPLARAPRARPTTLVAHADLEPLLVRQLVEELRRSPAHRLQCGAARRSAISPTSAALRGARTGRPRGCGAGRSGPCGPARSPPSAIASARLSFSTPSRVNTRTSITVPSMPGGTRSAVSFTSDAFSPKIARSSFSSGVSWVSPFGRDLADQDVARLDFGADERDAGFIQLARARCRRRSGCPR